MDRQEIADDSRKQSHPRTQILGKAAFKNTGLFKGPSFEVLLASSGRAARLIEALC